MKVKLHPYFLPHYSKTLQEDGVQHIVMQTFGKTALELLQLEIEIQF